ncbi:hypothetical protein HanIR_Chr16g0824331 [Helianthus annuus]|nr:hypothetical protein HanIR_Chr16g0824331 [Helianthus annuus]
MNHQSIIQPTPSSTGSNHSSSKVSAFQVNYIFFYKLFIVRKFLLPLISENHTFFIFCLRLFASKTWSL